MEDRYFKSIAMNLVANVCSKDTKEIIKGENNGRKKLWRNIS
jgi:hypothetical protein